jgi:isopentenyldiphosphate isomerase
MAELLDIVNKQDQVIGQMERAEVHKRGLTCRNVHICFVTPAGEIILQKRSLTKTSYPGRLTTTASGHVTSGESYVEAAVKEAFEETGIQITANDLRHLGTVHLRHVERPDYISDSMRSIFAYRFTGDVTDLQIEDGEGVGFVAMPISAFRTQVQAHPDQFTHSLADPAVQSLLDTLVIN